MDLERLDDASGGQAVGAYADVPLVVAETPSRRRGRAMVLGGVVVVVALVVAAIALLGGDGERDPERALARAQEALREATTLRFAYQATFEAPDLSEEGSENVDGTGEWTPDAWHILETSGEDAYEGRRIGGTEYFRSGWEDSPIEDEMWSSYEYIELTKADLIDYLALIGSFVDNEMFVDEDEPLLDAESYGVIVSLMVFLHTADSSTGMFLADPQAFLDSIQALSQPTVVAENGDVLTIAMPVVTDPALVEAFGHPIPDATVELDLDGDDRPTAMRFRVAGAATSVRLGMTFSDWGTPITIEAPDPADVEEQDESDDIFTMDPPTEVPVVEGVTPLRVGAVAGEWKIRSAEVRDSEFGEYEPGDDCPVLTLGWSEGEGRFSMMLGMVSIEMTPVACGSQLVPGDLPVGRPGELVIERQPLDESLAEIYEESDSELLPMLQPWVIVTDDTVATMSVGMFAEPDRAESIADAIEITDWFAIQNDLAPA
jgi:hypothetical protein